MADGLVTVYGATGYTGRLCARKAVEAGLRVRLAGRRQDALSRLAAELGGNIETAVADATDPGSLRALAGTTDVLMTTVGPYEHRGRPVLDAAIAGGASYVDVSAEPSFLGWAYDQDRRAADAGVALCPGLGCQGALGELLAAIAAGELPGAVREVRIGYLVRGGRASAGTVRSLVDVVERGGVALVAGRLTSEPTLIASWRMPFPQPLGARPGASVPAAEIVTVGRSLGATEARVYFALPGLPGAVRAAGLLGRASAAAARTPLWRLVRAGADLLPAGPAAGRRARTRCAVVAEVAGAEAAARVWARFSDPYGTTARIVVAATRRLLDGAVEPGARTPSQVAGDPAAFLVDVGADWERLPV